MNKKELGIVVLATNAYFVLGLRFIRRFHHFYKGNYNLKFYFFSDTNPKDFLPVSFNVEFHHAQHNSWVDGTNSKFLNILKLANSSSDFLYYFDADTNINKDFTEDWMIGDLVGGEHYANRTRLKNGAGFDRNPKGNSYVPITSELPYTYCYGAFFGGVKEKVIDMMTTLRKWQSADQKINYEPPVNDESYINKYFHYNKAYIVPIEDFEFIVSDKGGLGNTRKIDLNIEEIKKSIKLNRDSLWDIKHKKLVWN